MTECATMAADVDPTLDPGVELDVPQLIRKLRRVGDLSQRELAMRLGLHPSTVARWETGEAEPTLAMFQRLMALVGWSIQVRDHAGERVRPMRAETVRDAQGRHYPAHLDVIGFGLLEAPIFIRDLERNRCAPGRRVRDRLRTRGGRLAGAPDHPTTGEIRAQLQWEHDQRRRKNREEFDRHCDALVARGKRDPRLPDPPCLCRDECFEVPGVCAGVRVPV